jgi:hypothetical protein
MRHERLHGRRVGALIATMGSLVRRMTVAPPQKMDATTVALRNASSGGEPLRLPRPYRNASFKHP